MDNSLAGILGFIISSVLIPTIFLLWKSHKHSLAKELDEMKDTIKRHQDDNVERRRHIYADIEKIKVDAEKTKTNYIQRFADLEKHISREFTVTNKAISKLSENVAVLVSKMDD